MRRSNLLQDLLIAQQLKEQIKVISDMAFDAVDHDGSGSIDAEELAEMMNEVAASMGIH